MKNIEVNIDNVKECWKLYEDYMEEYRKEHYSDDTNYDEFVNWCENELGECPNCGQIVWKDKQEHLSNERNAETDNVCDDCIESYGYYE